MVLNGGSLALRYRLKVIWADHRFTNVLEFNGRGLIALKTRTELFKISGPLFFLLNYLFRCPMVHNFA